jgi:hypothetical protein
LRVWSHSIRTLVAIIYNQQNVLAENIPKQNDRYSVASSSDLSTSAKPLLFPTQNWKLRTGKSEIAEEKNGKLSKPVFLIKLTLLLTSRNHASRELRCLHNPCVQSFSIGTTSRHKRRVFGGRYRERGFTTRSSRTERNRKEIQSLDIAAGSD